MFYTALFCSLSAYYLEFEERLYFDFSEIVTSQTEELGVVIQGLKYRLQDRDAEAAGLLNHALSLFKNTLEALGVSLYGCGPVPVSLLHP